MVVVSHHYRFVFLKTLKTAGTSIEVCLSRVLPDTDSLSPIRPFVEGHVARNYEIEGKGMLFNHMTHSQISDLMGDHISDYYFWCVERHPLDKCLSHYAMLKNSPNHNRGNQSLTWEEYVLRGDFPVDLMKWSDGKRVLVDKVLDYRKIEDEIPDLLKSVFDISSFTLDLRAKSGFRIEGIPALEEITSEQRGIIMGAFAKSNALLKSCGLSFE
jgi:hypothetical protein